MQRRLLLFNSRLLLLLLLLLPASGGAVMFAHSTVIHKYERAYLPPWLSNSWPWWALRVCLTKLCIDFLITAFALRSLRACVAVWASVHYLPLTFMGAVLLLGSIFPAQTPSEVAETTQQQNPAGPLHGKDHKAQCAASAARLGSGLGPGVAANCTVKAVVPSSHVDNSPVGTKQE
jgi:hypothetical protein